MVGEVIRNYHEIQSCINQCHFIEVRVRGV